MVKDSQLYLMEGSMLGNSRMEKGGTEQCMTKKETSLESGGME